MKASRKRITRKQKREPLSSHSERDAPEKMTNPKSKQFVQLHHNETKNAYCRHITPGHQFTTSNVIVKFFFKLSVLLCWGFWTALDLFISVFFTTSDMKQQQKNCVVNVVCLCFKGFIFFLFLLIALPFALVGFLIWCPLQIIRPRSFALYTSDKSSSEAEKYYLLDNNSSYKNIINPNDDSSNIQSNPRTQNDTFCVLTSNVCLMPEYLSRFNNLSNRISRAKKIGQAIINAKDNRSAKLQPNKISSGFRIAMENEMLVPVTPDTSTELKNSQLDFEIYELDSTEQNSETQSVTSGQWSVTSKELAVSDYLPPHIDFVCMQEVFDSSASEVLLKKLAKRYPHIIYDVWQPFHDRRMSIINSGLVIASKFPFMDVQFRSFPVGFREDQLACKGLLMAKVYVGEISHNHIQVGYIATTHLQAIEHPHASRVRCMELNSILRWLEEFKERDTTLPSNRDVRETVLFDVVTGDFNFDMESHCEENERNCNFRNIYRDPCMNDLTGQQHSWVVGTSIIIEMLHDAAINTPNALQKMMISELERPKFVYSTKPSTMASGSADGRRRIDYVVYKPCKEKTLVLKDYKFHTTFASLTDHVPVSMTFASC